MTPKAHQILDFIRQFIRKNVFSPTITEIGGGIKLSSRGTVYRYLEQLEEDGYLVLHPGKQRNIELMPKAWSERVEDFSLPILGRIAAGRPIEAILNQEYVDFKDLSKKDRYVLKVCGDSMIDEGIFDGDLVICRHSQRADNGDIVVALVDNQFATLKRFFRKDKNKITLKPANDKFEPVTYNSDRITVQGIMEGLLRLVG